MEVRFKVTGGYISHLNGTPWYDLPRPWPWHRCVPATVGHLYYGSATLHRCACGGYRWQWTGQSEFEPWQKRNARRHGTAHSLTVL